MRLRVLPTPTGVFLVFDRVSDRMVDTLVDANLRETLDIEGVLVFQDEVEL